MTNASITEEGHDHKNGGTAKRSERKATIPTRILSEENLQMLNDTCVQADGYLYALIREERARAHELAAYQQTFKNLDGAGDMVLDFARDDIALQPVDPLDGLKLYKGSVSSSETPMGRFLVMSPTRDPHPWMARTTMKDSGTGSGDMAAIDVRKLAAEMVKNSVVRKR